MASESCSASIDYILVKNGSIYCPISDEAECCGLSVAIRRTFLVRTVLIWFLYRALTGTIAGDLFVTGVRALDRAVTRVNIDINVNVNIDIDINICVLAAITVRNVTAVVATYSTVVATIMASTRRSNRHCSGTDDHTEQHGGDQRNTNSSFHCW